jgi:hypothetical protein
MIRCQKVGCHKEIKLVYDGSYDMYVHLDEAVDHAAQVPLPKGPNG